MADIKLEPGERVDVLMSLVHGENAVWRSGYTFVKYDIGGKHKGTVLVEHPTAIHKRTRWQVDMVRRSPEKPVLTHIIPCPVCGGQDCDQCGYVGGLCTLCNKPACMVQHEGCEHVCEPSYLNPADDPKQSDR